MNLQSNWLVSGDLRIRLDQIAQYQIQGGYSPALVIRLHSGAEQSIPAKRPARPAASPVTSAPKGAADAAEQTPVPAPIVDEAPQPDLPEATDMLATLDQYFLTPGTSETPAQA